MLDIFRMSMTGYLHHICDLAFRGTKGWHQNHKDVLPAYAGRKHHSGHYCSPDGHDALRQTGEQAKHIHFIMGGY